MKKILTILCILASVCQIRAGEPTTDRVYASSLAYDSEYELYYFDVMLEGANLYTAYGMDIQLPAGIIVEDEDYVLRNDDMYPFTGKLKKEYTHSVMSAFPYPDDHSHLRVGCMSTKNENMVNTSGTLFRVYVTINYEDNAWPLGSIKVYDVELNEVGAPFDAPNTETVVAIHSGQTSLPLRVSATVQWSTCILPFATPVPDGVKAYTCTHNDDEFIYLSEVESLEAYVPYILYGEDGFEGTISGTVAAAGYPESGTEQNGFLCGAVVPQIITEGYVLQNLDEGVKFYQIGEGDSFTIPAGKCWLKLPDNGKARSFGFMIEGTADVPDIRAIHPASTPAYNLSGRYAQNSKGLIIYEGNKSLNQ